MMGKQAVAATYLRMCSCAAMALANVRMWRFSDRPACLLDVRIAG
jgi:hypothetical protein